MNTDEIYKTGFGWICPSGEMIGCDLFNHISVLFKLPGVPELQDIKDKIDEAWNVCDELDRSGEHPEWHSYDFACEDAKHEIYERLMAAGFIRVGSVTREGIIAFEGTKAALNRQTTYMNRVARDIRAKHGRHFVIERREWNK